jgi:threonine dehydratase
MFTFLRMLTLSVNVFGSFHICSVLISFTKKTMLPGIPNKNDIIEAHERIKPYIIRTPLLINEQLNVLAGCTVFFKCENLQKIGAFKMRGAMNAALGLSPYFLSKGIATHSSGNHAQAIARAAQLLKTKSFIVMPHTAPEIKKVGVHSYGGEIFECEPTLLARETMLAEVIRKTSATEIHPFNNYDVMAGQATASLEIFEELNPDYLIAPVGGGGLLSGTILAAKYFSPNTMVIAGEPAGSDDAFRSLQSGKIEQAQSQTIADGLLTTLGDKTFPIIRDYVKEVITVTDVEIIAAMKLIWEKLKVITEPSAAVPLAALLKQKEKFVGKTVTIILSGGNVDFSKMLKYF